MKNPISINIPLQLSNGGVINTLHCMISSDEIEGYTSDPVKAGDEIMVDIQFQSSGDRTNHCRRAFVVIVAHDAKFPDHTVGADCTHFHASVRSATN